MNPMLSLQAVCAHSLCVFAHLLFLRGACKSGKFLTQLVPAVSIPCVCACVTQCCHRNRPNGGNYLASDVGGQSLFRIIKGQLLCQMIGEILE